MDIEIHGHIFDRFIYEYLQIDFSLPPEQIERIFWDNTGHCEPMPNIDKVLDYLKKLGICSGVISNLLTSGKTLSDRLNRLFPNNDFEFIVASSEYMFRKPNKMIFELAL